VPIVTAHQAVAFFRHGRSSRTHTPTKDTLPKQLA